ncbi:MAG: IS3 family transposase [Calditrichaeota bacterium]|nr:IS3 family transposase [Calditrichota bacterium]
MIYPFIDQHCHQHSVRFLCQVFKVSTSGYYAYRQRPESMRQRANEALLSQIRLTFREHKQRYGSPRMTAALKKRGVCCSENRVARLMKDNHLRAKMKKRFIKTTDSKHGLPLATDRVQRDFTAERPNQLWLSDITYIRTCEGWVYLAAILDVYSRKIVGWALEDHLGEALIHQSLSMALSCRNPGVGLIFHSDQGSQYAAASVRFRLKHEGILQSMSRKGDCYDNAMMESFFSTLKRELILDRSPFINIRDAFFAVKNYIEQYYNRVRLHSGIGYVSPVKYENQFIPT